MKDIPSGPGLGGQVVVHRADRFREGSGARAAERAVLPNSLSQESSEDLSNLVPFHRPGVEADSNSEIFARLVADWRAASKPISSVTEMAMLPEYQQIIGMGQPALPLILAELEREPDHWFWALKAITREDPVPQEARGDLRAMAEAWIRWGHENGVLAVRSVR